MNRIKTWRWMLAALLLALGWQTGWAEEFAIQSFDKQNARMVFGAVAGATNYSVLTAPTPTGSWSVVVGTIPPTAANVVTAAVAMAESTAFYRVVAYTNVPPPAASLYLVVDLAGGVSAPSYPVSYVDAVPPGGWTDEHKTTKLVMRRIPAGTFTMGSPSGELGRETYETPHQVTLTEDFYIGVFEVTQRQWELVMGNKPSFFTNATFYQTRPVEWVSYYVIRENPDNSDDPAVDWPNNDAVSADSFMGKMRAKTGLTRFDLPTEAQWEYACRAGTTTALNSGSNLTNTVQDARMNEVGRYRHNGGSGGSSDCDPSGGTALVGSYRPNAWGLYDMHGNVWEWCLDRYATYPGTVTDPKGPSTGSVNIFRSGSWNYDAKYCRSAHRGILLPGTKRSGDGFRACCVPSGRQ